MTHKYETPWLITSARLRRRLQGQRQKLPDFAKMTGPFLLLTGLVVKVANDGRSVLLRHSACRIWVHFYGRGQLPEGVRYGRRIAVIGRLRSYNVGSEYALTSAHCLGVSPQALIAAGLKAHPDAVLRHWNPDAGVTLE